MIRTRIKFCGITRAEDAQAAVALGVDALGFVFTRRSARFVGLAEAVRLLRALPPFVGAVALFMDDDPAWVREVVATVRPDLVQFHGEEAAADCTSCGTPWIKAVPMGSVADVASYATGYPGAAGFLLDAHASGGQGGGGATFDWSRATGTGRPLILAGGLDAGNVGAAIAQVRPYAVDVSSGIEAARGIKDARRMQDFVAAVRAADHALTRPAS